MDNNQEVRYDSLGRRIPVYDRKAAAKKRAKKLQEKYGEGYFSQLGMVGGKAKTKKKGGWLKELKIENPKLLKEIATKGSKNAAKKRIKVKTDKENRPKE